MNRVIKLMRNDGLFLAPLNNGEWMAGKGSYLYILKITDDHYTDPNLSISVDPVAALLRASQKVNAEKEL